MQISHLATLDAFGSNQLKIKQAKAEVFFVCGAGLPDGLFSNQKSQFG
jgi:hypothetical protein